MKYCPSPTCPYALKHRRPLEYRDDIVVCADCGATLTEAAPTFVPKPVSARATAPPMSREMRSRLVVTLVGAAVMACGFLAPALTFSSSVFDDGALGQTVVPLLQFGLEPFLLAFVLVEVVVFVVPGWRALRVGNLAARATLTRVALVLGAAALVIQINAWVRGATAANADSMAPLDLPSPGLLWAQWLAAHGALIGLALWVSRRGLLNGFALAIAVDFAVELKTSALSVYEPFLEMSVTLGQVLVLLFVLVAMVAVAVRLARSASTGALGPTVVPFPASGFTIVGAGAAISLLSTFSNLLGVPSPLATLNAEVYIGIYAFLTIDLALLLGFLFFRPRAVGALWARWVKGVDETSVVVRARALLPKALGVAAAFQAFMVISIAAIQSWTALRIAISTIGLVSAALVAVDFVEELRARRLLGPLVAIRDVHRMAEVEAIEYALGQARIPVLMRSRAIRAAGQFFAPHLPVEVMVQTSRAVEARALLDAA